MGKQEGEKSDKNPTSWAERLS